MDYAANLALFLQETKGSIFETWTGTMTANQQRELFGQFVGKGKIVINGEQETIQHLKKVPHWYGQDSDPTFYKKWNEL